MPADQAHKNRIKALDSTYQYGRAYRDSKPMAKAATNDPKLNPSGKAEFSPSPKAGSFIWKPGIAAKPDASHAARLRGARKRSWDAIAKKQK